MSARWLMKSEPGAYSWHQLLTDRQTDWNGVRNHQANNYMKAMKSGDQAFFYHSNEERAVIGVMRIDKAWHPDPGDSSGKFGMVGVVAVEPLKKPVTLADIKADARLQHMVFLKQSRLSVSPVTAEEWHIIVQKGG